MSDTPAYWQGRVDEKLDAIAAQLSTIAIEKDGSHRVIYSRLEKLEQTQSAHYAENATRWARVVGLGVGMMIGAGAVGGGAGALITSLIGG